LKELRSRQSVNKRENHREVQLAENHHEGQQGGKQKGETNREGIAEVLTHVTDATRLSQQLVQGSDEIVTLIGASTELDESVALVRVESVPRGLTERDSSGLCILD
jgi:hypothetical protein